MSVSIAQGSRETVRDLIFSHGRYTIAEQFKFNRCLALTEELWLAYSKGDPVCAWGLIPPTLLSETAYLWMVSIDDAEKHEFVLVRHSQMQIKRMLERYPLIVGHCEVGQDRSIRWLSWLGAKFGHPQGHLLPFEIRRT